MVPASLLVVLVLCFALSSGLPNRKEESASSPGGEPESPFLPRLTSFGHVRREEGEEKWAYTEVRPGAHMFWWLYYSTHEEGYLNRPLVIWLQGGPGGSGCGYGNFELIGPLDLELGPRETTWIQTANVLFIDNPVGTGYSYVEDLSLLTTDGDEIAVDLMTTLQVFLDDTPEFRTIPIWIYGQSYGGKMGAVFTEYLEKAIRVGKIQAVLSGVAMGNAWTSPLDSTLTWGPFIWFMSTTDDVGLAAIQAEAQKAKDAADRGDWQAATDYWRSTEYVVWDHTDYVDFYNILNFHDFGAPKNKTEASRNFNPMLDPLSSRSLDDLMNGVIREKLEIIPEGVTWGGQRSAVFRYQEGDFMKHVLDNVDYLLNNTDIHVVVYQGQLDIICDTKGALDWVQRLKWPGLEEYNKAAHKSLRDPVDRQVDTFIKAYQQFKFYWMLRAGHSVPADSAWAALRMLNRVLEDIDN